MDLQVSLCFRMITIKFLKNSYFEAINYQHHICCNVVVHATPKYTIYNIEYKDFEIYHRSSSTVVIFDENSNYSKYIRQMVVHVVVVVLCCATTRVHELLVK